MEERRGSLNRGSHESTPSGARDLLRSIAELDRFVEQNPSFDLGGTDLLDPQAVGGLSWEGTDRSGALPLLRALQRLWRIVPDPGAVALLLRDGIDSAQRLTALGMSSFVASYASRLEGGAARARQIFNSARMVKSRAMHLMASVHGVVASRHGRQLAGNVSESVATYFESLSSYQQIFGSLDYCECRECGSILGPAAYLVDLLRIIDLAITVPNPDVPPGLTLEDRRPDLGRIELTCANTSDEVPYLEIVNDIVGQQVENGLRTDGQLTDDNLYLTLAQTYYPFGLPFNLPLAQIRGYLESKKVSLAALYTALDPSTAPSILASRESLGLSNEQLANLKPPAKADLPKVLSANYGLEITATHLAGLDGLQTFLDQTGLELIEIQDLFLQNLSAKEVFDASGQYEPSTKGTELTLSQSGDRVTGSYDEKGGEIEGTMRGLVLSGHWKETSGSPAVGNLEFTFSADGSFTGKWSEGYGGKWQPTPWNGTRQAATPSTGGIIPHSFFINKVLSGREYLQITSDDPAKIEYQSLETLDTLNRFIRLSRLLDWPFAQLDWALTSLNAPTVGQGGELTNATSLDDDTFIALAGIQKLTTDWNLPFDLVTALWFDLRTIGVGNEEVSQAPFDAVFNNPSILEPFPGSEVYHPRIAAGPTSYVNPLYRETPLQWTVGKPQSPLSTATDRASAIVAAIPASADDIRTVAVAAFGEGATVDLTVSHLSLLYRHLLLAYHLGLKAADYLVLLGLLGLAPGGKLVPTLDPGQALSILETARWITASGLNVYDIRYLTTAAPSTFVDTGFEAKNVPTFLATLAQSLKPLLLQGSAFASQGITRAASEAYFQVLLDQGYVDNLGIVLRDGSQTPPDFS